MDVLEFFEILIQELLWQSNKIKNRRRNAVCVVPTIPWKRPSCPSNRLPVKNIVVIISAQAAFIVAKKC